MEDCLHNAVFLSSGLFLWRLKIILQMFLKPGLIVTTKKETRMLDIFQTFY